jgi:hypothetical protein
LSNFGAIGFAISFRHPETASLLWETSTNPEANMTQFTRQPIDLNTLTLVFARQTRLPEKIVLLWWTQYILSLDRPNFDLKKAYLQQCKHQAKQAERIAVAATTTYLVSIALGVGLLFSGKIPDKTLETVSKVMGSVALACTKRSKDANHRLDRAIQDDIS